MSFRDSPISHSLSFDENESLACHFLSRFFRISGAVIKARAEGRNFFVGRREYQKIIPRHIGKTFSKKEVLV
jgi:hypothetical protein